MAEFMEVIDNIKRMCGMCRGCAGCTLRTVDGGCLFYTADINCAPEKWNTKKFAEIEEIITDWAESHPELKYPSWKEAWKQLFPEAISGVPCPKHFIDERRFDGMCIGVECTECLEKPIPADIAEALGIKPVEV